MEDHRRPPKKATDYDEPFSETKSLRHPPRETGVRKSGVDNYGELLVSTIRVRVFISMRNIRTDFTPTNFFLRGYLRDELYVPRANDNRDIRIRLVAISSEVFSDVIECVIGRYRQRSENERRQFENTVNKGRIRKNNHLNHNKYKLHVHLFTLLI